MNILKIAIVMLVLIMSMGVVCAENTTSVDMLSEDNQDTLEITQDEIHTVDTQPKTFVDLQLEIINATDVLEINDDYEFNNVTDSSPAGVVIDKTNFVINGNGHIIDGKNQSRIFFITGTNITINNLTFLNANADRGSALQIGNNCLVTTNNTVFQNNTANMGVIFAYPGSTYCSFNDMIIDSTSSSLGVVLAYNSTVNIYNAFMMSSRQLSWGFIQAYQGSTVRVYDSRFVNTTSKYCTAIEGDKVAVIHNCTFSNLHAICTAGAISFKDGKICVIEDCTFENVTSEKNAGAVLIDVGKTFSSKNITETIILDVNHCSFNDCYSGFGGALMQLSGFLCISNCNFTNNMVLFDGGALYASCAALNISNSIFSNNAAQFNGSRGSFGGAIFFDANNLTLERCELVNNSAKYGGAIYMYDANYTIVNNTFENNIDLEGSYDDIFSMFDVDSYLDDNTYSGANSMSLNNTAYNSIDVNPGIVLVLLNNTIDVASLPTRFDLRDWGWVTPVRNQGMMGSCWSFGSAGAMESAILRYLGIEMDISENNMVSSSLQYSNFGVRGAFEGGIPSMGFHYALSWIGVFSSEYDTYDERGKISPLIATNSTIHIQDMVLLPARGNLNNSIDYIKEAILKYGALEVGYFAAQSAPFLNVATAAQYCNLSLPSGHSVTLIGWDDSYPKENFLITPPGDGAWIIKNSWGESAGIGGYYYISYYDEAFVMDNGPIAYVIANTEKYNKNYQYDLQGDLLFSNESNEYRNHFVALEDDLIAGVGTYFNDTNVEYTVEVYVNDVLKLVQKGVSPFAGFHTIQLDSFIPIKKGDEFTVLIKSNSVPFSICSRQHYINGSSEFLALGQWVDATSDYKVCSLKAYTVVDDTKLIGNRNIAVDYAGGSYFSVRIVTSNGHAVGAGAVVKFTINGKTYTVRTDKNGIAKIKISLPPKKYVITTTYKGKSVKNIVLVRHVVKATPVVVKKTAKRFYLKAAVKVNNKVVVGKWVVFKFNGKTYKAKTNAKGIAFVAINKVVINKLRAGRTYPVLVSFYKDVIRTTVKVSR